MPHGRRVAVAGTLLAGLLAAVPAAQASGTSLPPTSPESAPTTAAPTTAPPDPRTVARQVVDGVRLPSCLSVSVDGVPALDLAPDQPLVPASNQKLLTASWALATAPELRFTTTVRSAGRDGDQVPTLWLVGGADPMLSTAAFAQGRTTQYGGSHATLLDALADHLVASGIRRVGALLGDDHLLPPQRALPAWSPTISFEGHTGPLGALTVNHGFAYDPADPLGAGWSGRPAAEAARQLASLLAARGVAVGWVGEGTAPSDAGTLASVSSKPVADLVDELLTESDNNTAEGLLQGVGRLALGTDGSTAAGAAAVQAHLRRLGVTSPGTAVVDGSGLSHTDAVTCRELLAVLTAGGDALVGGLAEACRTGTLEHLLCAGPATANLRAKTGTLGNVKALTGVMTALSGRTVRFAFVVNGPGAPNVAVRAWTPLLEALSRL